MMINVGKRGANHMIKANNETGDVWVVKCLARFVRNVILCLDLRFPN